MSTSHATLIALVCIKLTGAAPIGWGTVVLSWLAVAAASRVLWWAVVHMPLPRWVTRRIG